MNTPRFFATCESPLGLLHIVASDRGVTQVSFGPIENAPVEFVANHHTDKCVEELCDYFEGERMVFSVSLDAAGTPFEQGVWSALLTVPFGETCSYLDIANRINNPKAIRAVGRANGANPIAIIVPCHRVIGSDGTLTGYGGELWRKRWLLDHEARLTGTSLF